MRNVPGGTRTKVMPRRLVNVTGSPVQSAYSFWYRAAVAALKGNFGAGGAALSPPPGRVSSTETDSTTKARRKRGQASNVLTYISASGSGVVVQVPFGSPVRGHPTWGLRAGPASRTAGQRSG